MIKYILALLIAIPSEPQAGLPITFDSFACHDEQTAIELAKAAEVRRGENETAADTRLEAAARQKEGSGECFKLSLSFDADEMPQPVYKVETWFGHLAVVWLTDIQTKASYFFLMPLWSDEMKQRFISSALGIDA